jgi:hypothetical protein
VVCNFGDKGVQEDKGDKDKCCRLSPQGSSKSQEFEN